MAKFTGSGKHDGHSVGIIPTVDHWNIQKGFLGNISEGGLCAVMPPEFTCELDTTLKGFVLQEPLNDKLNFEGRIAWKLDYEINKAPKLMLGLEFSNPLELPEQLMVISLAVES